MLKLCYLGRSFVGLDATHADAHICTSRPSVVVKLSEARAARTRGWCIQVPWSPNEATTAVDGHALRSITSLYRGTKTSNGSLRKGYAQHAKPWTSTTNGHTPPRFLMRWMIKGISSRDSLLQHRCLALNQQTGNSANMHTEMAALGPFLIPKYKGTYSFGHFSI